MVPFVVNAWLLQFAVIGLVCVLIGVICGYIYKRIHRRSWQDLETRLTRLERVVTDALPHRISGEKIASLEKRLSELHTDLTNIGSEVRRVHAEVNDLAAELATIEKVRTSSVTPEGEADHHAVPTADSPAGGHPVADAATAAEAQSAAEMPVLDRTSTAGQFEDGFIRAMVLGLRQRPDEWVTFGRLSGLIAIPGCDRDYVAAIAEYRPDLFAISNDRRLKLRHKVIEEITRVGVQNWHLPPRPENQGDHAEHANAAGRSSGSTAAGCYCNSPYDEILNDLKQGTVPEDALVSTCCWTTICRVRGLHLSLVDAETWSEICQRRGYLLQRENPRGF